MYEQIREDKLFIILYSMVTAVAMVASCYLMFRQGNAFAHDITPPKRLRRCTAAFLAVLALSHVWYMPIIFLTSDDDIRLNDLVGGLLDSMTLLPLAIIVMLAMLQDRRRPLWPVAVIVAPQVAGMAVCVATHSDALFPLLYVYFLLMCIGIIIYMVRALRQYDRWLRDNYADLEHKEVWQCFAMLAIMLLVFVTYASTLLGPIYQYAMQVVVIVMVCYLLWRVETLSDLSVSPLPFPEGEASDEATDCNLSTAAQDKIGQLLQQYCIGAQLYLQHDLTVIQLAKAVGTNRFYLSQYFSNLGMNYNAYINGLRINHFMNLYRDAVAAQHSFTIKQLAHESGYRSYNTFNGAFKRKTGLSVTAWKGYEPALKHQTRQNSDIIEPLHKTIWRILLNFAAELKVYFYERRFRERAPVA